MTDPLQPDRCAELLGALASPDRLRIVRCLRDGPRSVSQLRDTLDIPLVNVSHHLSVLRHAGLVERRKQGRNALYSLKPGLLQPEEADRGCGCLDLGCCRLELPLPPPPDKAKDQPP
jgi:DNA-binding transcriptional ArsR family regulator